MKLTILITPALAACVVMVTAAKYHTGDRKHEKATQPNEAMSASVSDGKKNCDTSLWRYVYNPSRLHVIKYCKTVTGVIEETNADEDGDQHMLLKLDSGQEDLLTKKNLTKKHGHLVIEAVCANKVLVKKAGTTCNGYINNIQLPAVGTHVRVTGSLVNDSHNGWNEIHPITKMEILR